MLLYLHGGMPEYFLTESHPTAIEDLFTFLIRPQVMRRAV